MITAVWGSGAVIRAAAAMPFPGMFTSRKQT